MLTTKYLDEMNCPLTGKQVNAEKLDHTIYYELNIAGKELEIYLCRHCHRNKSFSNLPFLIISSLMANNRWPQRSFVKPSNCKESGEILDAETVIIPEFFETASYPKSPKEKMDHFFLNLFKIQKFDGEKNSINLGDEKVWLKNYFKSFKECLYYYDGLVEKSLILGDRNNSNPPEYAFQITHSGLNKAVELQAEGNNSDKCFIAMAFIDEMKPYREAIKKSLNTSGFKPIIIDEEHLDSSKTIPDGILAGIKSAKFCIADFTNHRNGVYFESGYALGLGKQVIYICRKDEFEKAHFDIKQLQHIIYETAEELEKKLVDKIEAWIKD